MEKKSRFFLFILITFFFLSTSHAASPVWKITNGDHQVFIGGTIHMLTPSDYPLPPSFEHAYSQSAIIVFETDIKKMQTPQFQHIMLKKLSYSGDQTLKMVLSSQTYEMLTQHFTQRGIPMDQMIRFKPGMVALTMTVIETQRLGLYGTGVDEFFHARAMDDKKPTAHLETPEEQVSFIAGMGSGRENELINYAIQDTQKIPLLMPAMKQAWRKGDNNALKTIALDPLEKNFPGIYHVMFVHRNNAWIPKIEAMLNTPEIEFILVGAAHLAGRHGLLSQLASKGYAIKEQ